MKALLPFLFLLVSLLVNSQENCTCSTELQYVINYYEQNLPGFRDNVTPKNEENYRSFKSTLFEEAAKVTNEVACFKLLTYYVESFKDNHSGIRMSVPNIDETNEEIVKEFLESPLYQSRETYELTEQDLKQYPLDDIRGIYELGDSTYIIAIIPHKGPFRDYIGVIVESKSRLWKRGQVKMEIGIKKEGGYEALMYLRNHSLRHYPRFSLHNGILGDSWFKTSLEDKKNFAVNSTFSLEHRKINDSITYLKVPTFSGSYNAKLDSFYKAVDSAVIAHPYLIIDVRNNGGGSDRNAIKLMEYFYSQPIRTDKVDHYVTEDNINMWESWYENARQDTVNFGKWQLKWFRKTIKKLKKAKPNTFLNRSKGRKIKRKVKEPWPEKVVILYNKYCASSCETLLFWAKQSEEAILAGENSGGYVGYGEVGTVTTPCYGFDLTCTMTRYQDQRNYEVVGIEPDFKLDPSRDWILQATEILMNRNRQE